MSKTFTGRFIVSEDGQLVPEDKKCKLLKEQFDKSLPVGSVIEIFAEYIEGKNATLAQKAKIHAMTRELSLHTGTTFDGMKRVIKNECGLHIGDFYKSFADCNSDELNLAINAALEIASILNYPL